MSENQEIKFKFLPEKPLTDSNNALFGHGEIVTSLKRIIKNSHENNSLTVGLFGDWGSGKSTIVESLQKELSQESEPIPVVIFDVWKHEDDALRRTFLTHLAEYLNDNKYLELPHELNNRLKSSITDSKLTTNTTLKINWIPIIKKIKKIFLKNLLPLFLTFIILYSFLFIKYPEFTLKLNSIICFIISNSYPYIKTIFTFIFSSAVVILIIEKIIDFSTITNNDIENINYEKFEDPVEFESEFRNILKKIINQKITIVFDNLDRVKGDKATNIISTIKTFLEPIDKSVEGKEIVFIIPCDDKAIKKHLEQELLENPSDKKNQYADEYLRKFFNTSIRIPSFNTKELEDYAWNCLGETEIADLKDRRISSLITQAFNDNPRQIIQFVNTLISNYLVLWEREKNGSLGTENFLSNNSPQLAKYLLLELKFPDVMDIYRKNYLYDLNNKNISNQIQEEINKSKTNDFDLFLKTTENIMIDNLGIFFKFRITEHEKKLKNSSKLLNILETKNIKIIFDQVENPDKEIIELREFLISMNLSENNKAFSDIVLDKLNEKEYISYDFNYFLNNVLQLSNQLSIKLSEAVFDKVNSVFNKSHLIDSIELISPKILSKEFIESYSSHLKVTVNKIVESWSIVIRNQLSNDKRFYLDDVYLIELTECLINYSTKIKSDYKNELGKFFHNNYIDNFNSEVINLLVNNSSAQNIFLTTEGLSKFIGAINLDDFKDNSNSERLKFYEKIDDDLINVKLYVDFIKQINQLINESYQLSSQSDYKEFTNVIEFAKINIKKYNSTKINFNDNVLKNDFQVHINNINEIVRVKSKNSKELIIYCEVLEQLKTPFKNEIKNIVNEFLKVVSSDNFKDLLLKLDNPEKFLDEHRINNILNDRLFNEQDLFDLIYDNSSSELKTSLLIKCIEQRKYDFFWRFVEKLNYDISYKKGVSNRILEETNKIVTNSIKIEHVERFYKVLEQLKLSSDELDIKLYTSQLDYLINQSIPVNFKLGIQKMAQSNYLNSSQKSDNFLNYLKEYFKDLNSNREKIIEIINASKEIINPLAYDKLIKEHELQIITDLTNNYDSKLLKSILSMISSSAKIKLINSFVNQVIKVVYKDNQSQIPSFAEHFDVIFEEVKTNEIYNGLKDNLLYLVDLFLEQKTDNRLTEIAVKNLSLIKLYNQNIPFNLQNHVDKLFFDSNFPVEIKIQMEEYLSEKAIGNKLQIINAQYGANDKFINLTEKLNTLIKASVLNTVLVDNKFAGEDPIRGVPKVLKIKYFYMKEIKEIIINEKGGLKLP